MVGGRVKKARIFPPGMIPSLGMVRQKHSPCLPHLLVLEAKKMCLRPSRSFFLVGGLGGPQTLLLSPPISLNMSLVGHATCNLIIVHTCSMIEVHVSCPAGFTFHVVQGAGSERPSPPAKQGGLRGRNPPNTVSRRIGKEVQPSHLPPHLQKCSVGIRYRIDKWHAPTLWDPVRKSISTVRRFFN